MAKKPEPITGVVRRAGSPNWQLQIEIPKDVASRFTQKQWYRVSLGTSDVAAANAKAIPLIAEFRAKVDLYRRELEAEAREETYASDIMNLAASSGMLKAKTPKDTASFTKESTILAVRAGQQTLDDVRKELDEANRNVLAWSTTAQALREALNALESTKSAGNDDVITVSGLLERRCKKLTTKQAEGYRAAAKYVMSIVGDIPITEFRKATARQIRDKLEESDYADGTKKTKYSLIVALFNWALTEDLLEASPFSGVTIETEGKKSFDRGDFSYGDFGLMAREFCTQGPLQRFIPLIILMTGTRPEETAQLETNDVMMCKDDKPFIRLRETDDNTGLKNKNSWRDVPIPAFLWHDLGFGEYVKQRKFNNTKLLFDLKPKGGRYAAQFTYKYHTPWKKKHKWGLERGPHAFRHLFTFTFANHSTMGHDAELREMILGHIPTTTNTAGVYLKGYTLPRARTALDGIDWKALIDFSPLLPIQNQESHQPEQT
jgi:integrase